MLNGISVISFFLLPLSPPFIINHPETVTLFLSLPLWAALGDKACSETVIRRMTGENCDGTDFKMGVIATLPELSEWTLPEYRRSEKPSSSLILVDTQSTGRD